MIKYPALLAAIAFLTFPALGWSAPLPLTLNGKTTYTIALADDAPPPEKTAASELQKYLQQITGAVFPIRSEKEIKVDAPQILIGAGSRAKSLLPNQDWIALGQDGVVIQAAGQNLILAGGRPRGTLYAVFQFLEDDAGCRWWTPGESAIPHRPTLNLTIQNVSYKPPFDYREDYTNETQKDPFFAAILRENGSHQHQTPEWGGHYTLLGFVHTMGRLLPPKTYFKAHPEWYTDPLNHDLPCTAASKMPKVFQLDLSNPQVMDEMTRQALEWIKKNPSAGYISISQNDNRHYCRCPQCTKLAKEEGSQSAPVLKFVNAVAEGIHKKYPDFKVETLAYSYSIKPPKTIRPGKNVLIRVAPIGADFGHPMNSGWNKKDRDDFLAWAKISPQLFVWNYTTNFRFTMFPHPDWAGLADDLRFYAAHHVTGIFQESDAFTNGVGDFVQLRDWLIGHLMWNPGLDQSKLTDEFLNGYYGPAGTYLRQYLNLVEQSYLGQKRRLGTFNTDFSFFTLNVANQAIHLFQQAADAVKNDPVLAARVRQERLSLDAVVLHRLNFLRAEADKSGQPFAGPTDVKAALADFARTAKQFHVRNFSEGLSFDKGVAQMTAALGISKGK